MTENKEENIDEYMPEYRIGGDSYEYFGIYCYLYNNPNPSDDDPQFLLAKEQILSQVRAKWPDAIDYELIIKRDFPIYRENGSLFGKVCSIGAKARVKKRVVMISDQLDKEQERLIDEYNYHLDTLIKMVEYLDKLRNEERITQKDVDRALEDMKNSRREGILMIPAAASESYNALDEEVKKSPYAVIRKLANKGYNCWIE